mgnify:CR=1 FL=1
MTDKQYSEPGADELTTHEQQVLKGAILTGLPTPEAMRRYDEEDLCEIAEGGDFRRWKTHYQYK